MREHLVVALALEPAATLVTLWQGGAQRFIQRIGHGELALGGDMSAPARAQARVAAVVEALAERGEDAARPDAFVGLGVGAAHAGVYRIGVDQGLGSEASLVVGALAGAAGTDAFIVESVGAADLSHGLRAEDALLARAAVRRDARGREQEQVAGRIVVALEPSGRAVALAGSRIVASIDASVRLDDASAIGQLIRRSAHGDPAAADLLARFSAALGAGAHEAARAVQDVLVVILTGTLAAHAQLADEVARLVRGIAPSRLQPGARIDRALADAALDALSGRVPVHTYA
jgi:hypothetical protein